MSSLINVENISKDYIKGNECFTVLKDLSLDILKGEFLCILGPSGCGKSTLLKQIASLDKPGSGTVSVNSKEVVRPDTDRMLIFQEFDQLFPWKTVIDNIIFPLRVNKLKKSKTEMRQTALECLKMVSLNDAADRFPHQLSGGMKQKAAIARALAMNSEVLLMDEPFGSLDALTRASLQEMLVEVWKKSGTTIIFVTHDIHEAILLSDRMVVMGKDPGIIKKIIQNPLPRPRTAGDEKVAELYKQIYNLLEV